MKFILTICAFILSPFLFANETTEPAEVTADIAQPYVTFVTNKGEFVLELNPARAPITVANFLDYINSGHYTGTIFHRVIKDFMIQGGGFTENMTQKATKDQIKNEANNGLFNNRGTVAMARTGKVDSATSQFFVNIKNNYFLNNGYRDFGYAVFGKVVSGMELLDNLSLVETGFKNGMKDVPVEAIIVNNVKVSYEKPAAL
jgi:peptidyl-prolyl cis-trans isomerase A (cyclophilin A)